MKKSILITLLISSLNLFAQTNTKLDNRNGFKIFKFGSSINDYKDILKPISGTKDEFELSTDKISSLFGLKWEKLFVSFSNDKLVSIGEFWKDDKVTYQTLLTNLEKIFGTSKITSETIHIEKQDGLQTNVWEGKNVIMILSRDNTNKAKLNCENCKISLVMISNGFLDNFNLENDF